MLNTYPFLDDRVILTINVQECFRLVLPRGGGTGASVQDPPTNILGKFDDGSSGYDIDPINFYLNANACEGGNGLGSPVLGNGFDSNFPHCLFNLPVVRLDGDPCSKSRCSVGTDDLKVTCTGIPSFMQAICAGKTDRGYDLDTCHPGGICP